MNNTPSNGKLQMKKKYFKLRLRNHQHQHQHQHQHHNQQAPTPTATLPSTSSLQELNASYLTFALPFFFLLFFVFKIVQILCTEVFNVMVSRIDRTYTHTFVCLPTLSQNE
uniref:Uncharacterized protein n=1 Tax=Glossina austeni TaxID=7395 RepID=A0A1A9V593_GLOAU